ncbi:MAG: HAD-IIB family hydrolase [Rhizobiales bacterium]|nr:HAD-IIB family hydrolase [Hyphomicrobiales bacterium]MBI3673403.1 HAD-IIB family hydrolase [Hyphomicrobiales bacterium]
MTLLPLQHCPASTLSSFIAVLTDIDDTLTLHGRLPPQAFAALDRLRRAGLKVVPVTGRPAGWCDHIARQWPVDGVVGENGAFYFRYDEGQRKMARVYAQSAEERRHNGERLRVIARRVLAEFPGTAIAADQAYRETDVAIDYCEDVPPLPLAEAQKIADFFAAEGAKAKVSSIHVNAWFGAHDKLAMSGRLLREAFEIESEIDSAKIAYAGDSPNDAPMFQAFENGFGMANLKPFVKLMAHLPKYLTAAEGGLGFAELTEAILAARRPA